MNNDNKKLLLGIIVGGVISPLVSALITHLIKKYENKKR